MLTAQSFHPSTKESRAMKLLMLIILPFMLPGVKTLAAGVDSACRAALSEQHFIFRAEWASNNTGQLWQLTPPYHIVITKDSAVGYLPFYGRMYRMLTPQEFRQMAIQFSSSDFSYILTQKRKKTEISMRLRDHKDALSLDFSVASNGSAVLWIRSGGHDPMMYEGAIETPP